MAPNIDATIEEWQPLPPSELRAESKRLRDVDSLLLALWQSEVLTYENSALRSDARDGKCSSKSPFKSPIKSPFKTVNNDGSISSSIAYGAHRNRPNKAGTVEDEVVFPYHNSLYPLLDCYDSVLDDDASNLDKKDIKAPSPAPKPYHANGHRRSRFSPRVDPNGFDITELPSLEGHLPNSAWATKESLMPHKRKDDFAKFIEMKSRRDESNNGSDHERGLDNDEAFNHHHGDGHVLEHVTHHHNPRFWSFLMKPFSEDTTIQISDVSLLAEEETDYLSEIYEDERSVDNEEDEWEDIEDEKFQSVTSPKEKARNARDFTFLGWWENNIMMERRGRTNMPTSRKVNSTETQSPENISSERHVTASVLLKVLKHSMSDLQRDFRLARGVLLLIADMRLFDCDGEETKSSDNGGGVEFLRRFLCVVSSEYVPCEGYCHEWHVSNGGQNNRGDEGAAFANFDGDDDSSDHDDDTPNHYCSDWWEFMGSISTAISFGITALTQEHAVVICSFVNGLIDNASAFPGLSEKNDDRKKKTFDNNEPSERNDCRHKAYLKQNIFFQNNSELDDDEANRQRDKLGPQIQIYLILAVLSALRRRVESERLCMIKLLDTSADQNYTSINLEKTLKSFNNSIRAIVDIGESVLLRLPTNSHTCRLGGMVVRCLLEAYVDTKGVCNGNQLYIACQSNSNLRSVIDPLRYADSITNAARSPLLDVEKRRTPIKLIDAESVEDLIGRQPPNDVQDLVKALFMRDLVDFQISGCGFGDFLSWCNLPIFPQTILFDYITNFPDVNANEENEGEDEEPDINWVSDEDGIVLNHANLSARYDFTLMMFMRAFHSPWNPKSHLSYQVPFRRAINALTLCAHRYGMPSEIVLNVGAYLRREWWPDSRRCCWSRQCEMNKLRYHYKEKIESREHVLSMTTKKQKIASTFLTCKCTVAMACSKEHMKHLVQDGHKRYCGLPPFRATFGEDDNAFCREVLGRNDFVDDEMKRDSENGDGFEERDDDGSEDWESVDSNEDHVFDGRTRTEKIFTYFNEKSYKHQRRQALPFSNLF